jgi:hypothetical protein
MLRNFSAYSASTSEPDWRGLVPEGWKAVRDDGAIEIRKAGHPDWVSGAGPGCEGYRDSMRDDDLITGR